MTPTASLDAPPRRRTLLAFVIVTLIWGSTWTVIRGQLGVVPSGWSVTYRFAIASAAMFAVAWRAGVPLRLGGRDQLFLMGVGLAQFVGNFNFVYLAETHVTSGLVAVTFALLVVCNAALARIFLGQTLSRRFVIGSGVAMLGVALLFAHELARAPHGPRAVAIGVGLTLAAVLSASISNVMQGSTRARAMAMPALLGWSMLWGALADGALAWATSGPPRLDPRPEYWLGLLYLGVIASALAFTLYFTMIRAIGPARGGYVNVVVPVIAMTFSTVLEHYIWSVEAVLGGVLVLAGLVLAMRARAAPAR